MAEVHTELPIPLEIPLATLTTPLATKPRRPALTVKDFKGRVDPDWCPGCGDFGVLNALKTAVAELGLLPHEVLTVSGIGCSSNLPGYINTYGMHTLHGRSLAVATGAQLGNHRLKVIVTGGDGDGFGIGINHFVHGMRRNVDLTYIVMDNQIYGLTTGQVSPTSRKGMKTKSMPFGNVEGPINPISLALSAGATWWFIGWLKSRNLVAEENHRTMHEGAVPQGGGVSVVLAVIATAALIWPWNSALLAAISSAAALGVPRGRSAGKRGFASEFSASRRW